jgi:hypothetical protein
MILSKECLGSGGNKISLPLSLNRVILKQMQTSLKYFAIASFLILSLSSAAQKKAASPRDSVSAKIGKATVSINYGSPSVKSRKIWGELVPYGQVWRAGANEATTFTTDRTIIIAGKRLPAGKYGFFVIPNENEWVIIFNKVANQWGAYEYKEKEDVLRVKASPKKSNAMQERLVYKMNKNGFSILWENLEVPIVVAID